jgi:inner membrane protein COX18
MPTQAKRRQWRAEEQALPILKSEGPTVAKRVLEDMQKEKVRGTKEELRKMHGTRTKEMVCVLVLTLGTSSESIE